MKLLLVEETSPYRVRGHAPDIEVVVSELTPLSAAFPDVPNTRWVSLRLLNADEAVRKPCDRRLGQLVMIRGK